MIPRSKHVIASLPSLPKKHPILFTNRQRAKKLEIRFRALVTLRVARAATRAATRAAVLRRQYTRLFRSDNPRGRPPRRRAERISKPLASRQRVIRRRINRENRIARKFLIKANPLLEGRPLRQRTRCKSYKATLRNIDNVRFLSQ